MSENTQRIYPIDPLAPMHFDDIEDRVVPVTIKGKQYRLREGDAETVRQFKNMIYRAVRSSSSKNSDSQEISIGEGAADTETFLVHRCLFEVCLGKDGSEFERRVDLKWVRSLGNRIVSPLFKRAEMLTGLGKWEEQEEEKSKNELPDTVTG